MWVRPCGCTADTALFIYTGLSFYSQLVRNELQRSHTLKEHLYPFGWAYVTCGTCQSVMWCAVVLVLLRTSVQPC